MACAVIAASGSKAAPAGSMAFMPAGRTEVFLLRARVGACDGQALPDGGVLSYSIAGITRSGGL
jgi:hypothetical protein